MRNRLAAATAAVAVTLLVVPALAQGLELLGGSWFPKDLSKDACSWSRPHIVFENNSKTRIRGEYALGTMDQDTKDIKPNIAKIYVEPGKEIKEIFQDQSSVLVMAVIPDTGQAYNTQTTRLNFHYCPSGTKGELSNNFPAWKFTYHKDGSFSLSERKK